MNAEVEVAEDIADELMIDVVRGLAGIDWLEVAALAGSNAQDRQAIKRKAMRWRDNFVALPPLERLAVLGAMAQGLGS